MMMPGHGTITLLSVFNWTKTVSSSLYLSNNRMNLAVVTLTCVVPVWQQVGEKILKNILLCITIDHSKGENILPVVFPTVQRWQ